MESESVGTVDGRSTLVVKAIDATPTPDVQPPLLKTLR